MNETLFPTREDMTVAPVYDEFSDTEVERVLDLRDSLWSDPPATPHDTVGEHHADDDSFDTLDDFLRWLDDQCTLEG